MKSGIVRKIDELGTQCLFPLFQDGFSPHQERAVISCLTRLRLVHDEITARSRRDHSYMAGRGRHTQINNATERRVCHLDIPFFINLCSLFCQRLNLTQSINFITNYSLSAKVMRFFQVYG